MAAWARGCITTTQEHGRAFSERGQQVNGAMYVIDQLGQTIMQRDRTIAQLTAEKEQLEAKVATLQPEPAKEQE